MRKYIPKFGFWYTVKLVILFVIYFITARFGLSIFAVHTFATIIWPPTGIALAFLILYGYDLWPAILIGAFAVNLYTGAPIFVALGIGIGNTLEAVIGTYLLRRYINLYRCFERLRDTILFIAIVALIATVISATIGVSCLLLGHLITLADAPSTWLAWWVGDTLGALIITPFLLVCVRPSRPWNKDNLSWTEIICGIAFLLTSNLLIFWFSIGHLENSPLLYLILFPLIWGGIRFGSRGMTIAILTTSIFAVFSTVFGHGPFVTIPPQSGLLFLQIFIGTLTVTFLIFLSIVKERRASMEKLQEHVGELEHAVKTISSADRAKNDFLAILAHELRNPLAPVLSSLELMKMRINDYSEMAPIVKTMETHIYTMSHLLDDILDISRISRKKFKLEKEVFSLQTIIARSVETVGLKMQAKDHSLLIKVTSEPIWLFGDPLRIEQILVNLLINASKYTKPKGRIVLSCMIEEDVVMVSVKDNGVGIAPNMIDKIFEPFMQAINREDMRSDAGLGIGLALTKKLVELHNGNIVAKSDGEGFGSILTRATVTGQLRGELSRNWSPEGLVIRLSLPRDRLTG